MKKAYLVPISMFTISIPIYFDIFFEIELWSILIIPAFLMIIYFPSWKIGLTTIFILTIIQLTIELVAPEIRKYDLTTSRHIRHLFLDPFVNILVLMTLTYYRIRGRKAVQQLEELTIHDPLTGVYNRRYFDKILDSHKDPHSSIVVILLDIDHFKKINDHYGHLAGDEILKMLVKVVNKNIRGLDSIVRFGGEEFALILPETDLEYGVQIAERIRLAVQNETYYYNNREITVTISLGVAPVTFNNLSELVEKADQALYKAKNNGRNQVCVS